MNEWNEWRMNKFNKINNYFFIFFAGSWKNKNCLAKLLCISHIPSMSQTDFNFSSSMYT